MERLWGPWPLASLPEPEFVALDFLTGRWRFTPLWADGAHDDSDAVERVLSGGVAIPRADLPRYIVNVQALFDRYPPRVLPARGMSIGRTITALRQD